jgi:hypothetical protein
MIYNLGTYKKGKPIEYWLKHANSTTFTPHRLTALRHPLSIHLNTADYKNILFASYYYGYIYYESMTLFSLCHGYLFYETMREIPYEEL